MAIVPGAALVAIGLGTDSAGAAIEADAIDRRIVDDGLVVNVVNIGHIDVGDRPVVVIIAAAPVATKEPGAGVAEAIINSAVEADVRAPVAGMPDVKPFIPAPIAGGPKKAGLRGEHPRAGNPEIVPVIVVVSPVTGSPDIARSGADGLSINGKCRRANSDGNADGNLRMRWSGNRQDSGRKSESTNKTRDTHDSHLSGVC